MELSIIKTIELLVRKRNKAIKVHDFTRGAEIERDLNKINVSLKDAKEGTYWYLS